MEATHATSKSPVSDLKVVWVLASKDIIEAVRNRTTLTVLLGLSLMMLTVQAMPLLLKLDARPRLVVADAERTDLADTLREDATVQVRELRNEDDAIAAARQSGGALISVVLPEGWDTRGGPLTVDGYYVHWLGEATAADMVSVSQGALSRALDRAVTVEATPLYPNPDSRGREIMVSLGLVLAIILVTAIIVPYLILDEKSAHTLEVLYVSPASPAQVVMGKGIAGMAYGALAAAVLLAFNASMVVSWGLTIVTVIGGALLGVGLGLLVGLVVDNEGAVQLWVGGLCMVFMFPLMMVFAGSNLSPWTDTAISLLPSSAMFSLFRSAFGNIWQWSTVGKNLAVLLGSALVVHALVVWRMRRWEAA